MPVVTRGFQRAICQYPRPSRVRSDYGGENLEVGCYIQALHGDQHNAWLQGSSVHNQRNEWIRRIFTTDCVPRGRQTIIVPVLLKEDSRELSVPQPSRVPTMVVRMWAVTCRRCAETTRGYRTPWSTIRGLRGFGETCGQASQSSGRGSFVKWTGREY